MIDSSFEWKILVGKEEVNPTISPFAALSQYLVSMSDVFRAVQCIESCHFCTGNEDSRYIELQVARQGKFVDLTGNI